MYELLDREIETAANAARAKRDAERLRPVFKAHTPMRQAELYHVYGRSVVMDVLVATAEERAAMDVLVEEIEATARSAMYKIERYLANRFPYE
jgi:dihydroxyacetone kinase